MAKYSEKSQKKVERAMHEYKHGELKSGKGGKGGTVKNRKQAIAIGLSEASEAAPAFASDSAGFINEASAIPPSPIPHRLKNWRRVR